MRCLLFVIGLLTAPLGAFALTWDFDEGTTWGWTAHESLFSNATSVSLTTVYSEVEDGVWRIAPVPDSELPAITLYSPPIGEDSALFDWVTLRLRIIHHTPTEGRLQMGWFNAEYRRLTEGSDDVWDHLDYAGNFYVIRYHQLYSTEWQDITIDIRALKAAAEADPGVEVTWQDTLFNFQIDLDLNTDVQGLDDHPVFVEVDWIQLTGKEELLLGELQPQEIAVEAGLPGTLFTAPDYFPLGVEIRDDLQNSPGTLGDVDGDGDVDLVAVWYHRTEEKAEVGWMVAFNDGLGGFVPTLKVLAQKGEEGFSQPIIAGNDFDGDGLLDLAFQDDDSLELWLNRGEDGFETILQLSDVWLIGLADGDGDGDVDLLVQEHDNTWLKMALWVNDGAAGFVRSNQVAHQSEEGLFPRLLAGQPLGEAVRLLWNRPCYQPQGTWQLTRPWSASEEPPLFFKAVANPCDLHLLVDLDGDGVGELIGSPERDRPLFSGITLHGLALWDLDASGVLNHYTLLGPQVTLPGRATASDLNGDGLLDLAVVNGNLATGPAVIVWVGQRNGVPVLEGRYPLPGIGGVVLAGDVNGDGKTDLVVLGRSVEGGPGGTFVFINQGVPSTAAAIETMTTPSAFALGANYPNPFNPGTTIPFAVPAGVGDVDLAIYNVLGQPVRQVWAGPLAAGEHRLAWDGRDAQGQSVAAGVYLYRLQVGDQTRIRKMVKLE